MRAQEVSQMRPKELVTTFMQSQVGFLISFSLFSGLSALTCVYLAAFAFLDSFALTLETSVMRAALSKAAFNKVAFGGLLLAWAFFSCFAPN